MLRRGHTRTVERESEKENERCASEASACVVLRADLRRGHTRTVERVALGEGSGAKRSKAKKVARQIGVQDTRWKRKRREKKTREGNGRKRKSE